MAFRGVILNRRVFVVAAMVAVAVLATTVASRTAFAGATEPDRIPPSVTLTGSAVQAVEDGQATGTYELHIVTTDGSKSAPQSGVGKVEVLVDGSGRQSWEKPCPEGSCGLEVNWTYSPGTYPAVGGGHVITVKVTDRAGNVAEQKLSREGIESVPGEAAPTGTDATPPDIGYYGSAARAIEEGATSGSYELRVAATDGSPTAPQSGVAKIELAVDGTIVQSYEKSCPVGSCFLEVSWPYSPGNFTGTGHVITITVRDRAGNVTTRTLEPTSFPRPVAAWSFEEGTGTLVHDLTGNGHEGTLSAAGVGWAPGKYGKALKFDGKEGCVTVPDSPALRLHEGFTLEAWVLPEGELLHLPVITKQAEGFPGYGLGVGMTTAGRAEGQIGTATRSHTDVVSPTSVPINQWTHEAVTFDGQSLRLYVNGSLAATQVASLPASGTAGPLEIGCSASGHFRGVIDEARIYAKALSAEQVMQTTTAAFPAAVTESIEEVEANFATLTGTADSNGGQAEYFFEYGPTTSYGHVVEGESIGHESAGIKVRNSAVNLTPGTLYNVRLVTQGPAGTTYGINHTFITGKGVETAEQEAERQSAEKLFEVTNFARQTAPKAFFGMDWSGDLMKLGKPEPYETIAATKAHQVRVLIFPDDEGNIPSVIDGMVTSASAAGLEVIPYFGSGPYPLPAASAGWVKFAKSFAEKYGPGGTSPVRDITAFEIWNEPNMPFPIKASEKPENPILHEREVNPRGFAVFLDEMSKAIKSGVAANKQKDLRILSPGLFGYKTSGRSTTTGLRHLTPEDFLLQMNAALNSIPGGAGTASYTAISIHPYAFFVGPGAKKHAPHGTFADAEKVQEAVASEVASIRRFDKPVWVTEIGFPAIEFPQGGGEDSVEHPPVGVEGQKVLTKAVLSMLINDWKVLNISHVLFYNIQDLSTHTWENHCGLLETNGVKRPAWSIYKALAEVN